MFKDTAIDIELFSYFLVLLVVTEFGPLTQSGVYITIFNNQRVSATVRFESRIFRLKYLSRALRKLLDLLSPLKSKK